MSWFRNLIHYAIPVLLVPVVIGAAARVALDVYNGDGPWVWVLSCLVILDLLLGKKEPVHPEVGAWGAEVDLTIGGVAGRAIWNRKTGHYDFKIVRDGEGL